MVSDVLLPARIAKMMAFPYKLAAIDQQKACQKFKVNVSKWCHVLVADLTIVQSGSLFRKCTQVHSSAINGASKTRQGKATSEQ